MYRGAPATLILSSVALAAVLAGCASPPAAPAAGAVVRPSPSVYFYPLHGQTASQQDRDRYECYRRAHRQTGYDPSLPRPDGAAADASQQRQAQGVVAQANAQADVAVTAYRDAMKSCLAARGYSVQ